MVGKLDDIDFSQARREISLHAPDWAKLLNGLLQNPRAGWASYKQAKTTQDGPFYAITAIICRARARTRSDFFAKSLSIGWMLMLISGRPIEVRITSKSPTLEPSCRKPPQERITRSVSRHTVAEQAKKTTSGDIKRRSSWISRKSVRNCCVAHSRKTCASSMVTSRTRSRNRGLAKHRRNSGRAACSAPRRICEYLHCSISLKIPGVAFLVSAVIKQAAASG
jgi:hypothetical protein